MPMTPTSLHVPKYPAPNSSPLMTKHPPHGGIDVAQINRIARIPGSSLIFASFDPATASGDRLFAFRKLTLNEEMCRPKRVVVEVGPDGRCSWRFVPRARSEEGVESEGIWPRTVDLCGEQLKLSQDQWDAYKLDPEFDCLIRQPPSLPLITRSLSSKKASAGAFLDPLKLTSIGTPSPRKPIAFKRHLFTAKQTSTSRFPNVTADSEFSEIESDAPADSEGVADEVEVDSLVTKNKIGPKKRSSKLKKVHENIEEARWLRREWNARRRDAMKSSEDNVTHNVHEAADDIPIPYVLDEDEIMMSAQESSPLRPSTNRASSSRRAQTAGPSFEKRKARVDADASDSDGSDIENSINRANKTYEAHGEAKRVRTMSPSRAAKVVKQKRFARGQKRLEEQRKRMQNRAAAKEQAILKELMGDLPGYSPDNESFTQENGDKKPSMELDDEASREAAIEESKRKIAELEADKPLWEEQARRRAAQAEEERGKEAKRRKEAQAKAADESRREKEQRAEEERRKVAEAAFELKTRREKTRKQAQREINSWRNAPWTSARALERYRTLCSSFDSANFIRGEALTLFETIPWPVLLRPGTFGVEDVDWASVEAFFSHIRQFMPSKEFRELVEKSHKRFHPDRWRSRRVLVNVPEDEERECLEVAANTVAQALTPLWQEVTGR